MRIYPSPMTEEEEGFVIFGLIQGTFFQLQCKTVGGAAVSFWQLEHRDQVIQQWPVGWA